MIVFKLFLFYMFYSFLGWIVEVIDLYVIEGKFVNRGFLIGPYCPIYGKSILLITLLLKRYEDNIILLFIMSMIICTIVEYIGSFLLEKVFKTRWWDYSHKKFNINGRVCLENTILFGFGSVIVIYALNPFINNLINLLPDCLLITISIILFIIYFIDNIISLNIILHFSSSFKNCHIDETENVTELVKKELIKQNKKLYNRLIKSFPKLKILKRKKNKNVKNN